MVEFWGTIGNALPLKPSNISEGMAPLSQFEEHLRQWHADGRMDSEGSFTISWQRARQKMLKFHASNPARYILLLISAGIAWGASQVEVTDDQVELVLRFPRAKVSEERLSAALESFAGKSGAEDGIDFFLGVRGAQGFGATMVVLESYNHDRSFRWSLAGDTENREPLQLGDGIPGVVLSITRGEATLFDKAVAVLKRFGGFAGCARDTRMLLQYCDHSYVPISLNTNPISESLSVGKTSIAVVGEPNRVLFHADNVLRVAQQTWSAVLWLGGGRLRIVVHGVRYESPLKFGLEGVVWNDNLQRDISREQILDDEFFQRMAKELRTIGSELRSVKSPGRASHDFGSLY